MQPPAGGTHPGAPAPIVDAHLDLAWNVANGRDLTRRAKEIRASENKSEYQCMVSFPDMSAGGVALVFGSIFVMRGVMEGTDHAFDPEIAARGKEQIDIYRRFEDDGVVRIIRTKRSLDDHLAAWETDRVPGLLIAMEGAEPIESVDELQWWFAAAPCRSAHSACEGPLGSELEFRPRGSQELKGIRVPWDLFEVVAADA